jgi:hypothetical protein
MSRATTCEHCHNATFDRCVRCKKCGLLVCYSCRDEYDFLHCNACGTEGRAREGAERPREAARHTSEERVFSFDNIDGLRERRLLTDGKVWEVVVEIPGREGSYPDLTVSKRRNFWRGQEPVLDWREAEIGWPSYGSVSRAQARRFARALTVAMTIAHELDEQYPRSSPSCPRR